MEHKLKSRYEKLLPILLIVIPLVVLGSFVILDEREGNVEENRQTQDPTAVGAVGSMVEGLSIVQQTRHASLPIFYQPQFINLNEPRTFGYHPMANSFIMVNLYFNEELWTVALKDTVEEWLEVVGAQVKRQATSDGHPVLQFRLTELEPEISINIQGLPTMTLREMEPLTYSLGPNNWEYPAFLANEGSPNQEDIYSSNFRPSALFVASEIREIDLHFSEQMIKPEQVGQSMSNVPGEWISPSVYKVYITEDVTGINLHDLYSLSGNQAHSSHKWIPILRKLNSEWIDVDTSEVVFESKYSQLYDVLIPAPDGLSAIGLVEIMRQGEFYDVFFERLGKEPYKIGWTMYFNLAGDGYPLQWLDHERVLFFTADSIKIYNFVEGSETALFLPDEGKSIISTAVDLEQQKVHLYLKQVNTLGKYSLDYKVVSLSTGTVEQSDEAFVEFFGHQNYFFQTSFNVVKHDLGLFRSTLSESDEQVTIWTKPNGGEQILDGHVLFSFTDGLLLQQKIPVHNKPAQTYSWWLSSNGQLTELEMMEAGDYHKLGDYLLRFQYPDGYLVIHYFNKQSYDWFELDNEAWRSLPNNHFNYPYIKQGLLNHQVVQELLLNSK